ncbi:MAG: 2Fe-2S iron-sulfur cluster binding domain-containing protein [Clostridia bacterium]|nr:2Fe-2S iron-sulfur cluster binding domain-containing protein [Clostridia bacterium]
MIFDTDAKTAERDLGKFLSLTRDRLERFEKADPGKPQFPGGVNESQLVLHPGERPFRLLKKETSPNGVLFAHIAPSSGAAPVFRAGQQARVRVRGVTRPVFFASAPGEPPCLGVCVDGQLEAFAFLDALSAGDELTLNAPVGNFYILPPRDGADILLLSDRTGLPAVRSISRAFPPGSPTNLRVFCAGCVPEPFFDSRFTAVPDAGSLPERSGNERVFVCGSDAFSEAARERYSPVFVRSAVTDDPKRDRTELFTCTVFSPEGETAVPCSAGETLLSSLERAGVRIRSNCVDGTCGFCRCRLVSGGVSFRDPEDRDPRRRADIREGIIHPCRVFPDSDIVIEL